MKALFPSKGVVIVTKYNVNMLKDYYKNNLINSKLFGIYQQSNYSIQVGNLKYPPKKSDFILNGANLLTLKQLQEYVLKQTSVINNNSNESQEKAEETSTPTISDKPLDDNFVKNNPFFDTLTSLND